MEYGDADTIEARVIVAPMRDIVGRAAVAVQNPPGAPNRRDANRALAFRDKHLTAATTMTLTRARRNTTGDGTGRRNALGRLPAGVRVDPAGALLDPRLEDLCEVVVLVEEFRDLGAQRLRVRAAAAAAALRVVVVHRPVVVLALAPLALAAALLIVVGGFAHGAAGGALPCGDRAGDPPKCSVIKKV